MSRMVSILTLFALAACAGGDTDTHGTDTGNTNTTDTGDTGDTRTGDTHTGDTSDTAVHEYTHPGGVIGTETWKRGIHTLQGSIDIKNGTVTVEGCSEIRMPVAGSIEVRTGGGLRLAGTADCPILVTSLQNREMIGVGRR